MIKMIEKMLRENADMYTYVMIIRFESNVIVRNNNTARRVSIISKNKLINQFY